LKTAFIRLCRFALLALPLSVVSCGPAPDGGIPVIETEVPKAGATLVCRVDAAQPLGPVHRGLFGTNLEWFNYANDLSTQTGELNGRLIQLAREQGITSARFPGGTLSDFYHWRDGTGRRERRPVREHPTDTGRSPNIFGMPEFAQFCSLTGAAPLITVNAGTADAAEAADWVAYCNRPVHPERAADGMPAPLNVKLWEVGNELYLPGNPGDKKKITVSPETYAARFLEFAKAMRAVDPNIKLMGIGVLNATRVQTQYPDWTEVLLKAAADQLDFVAVHPAYFPFLIGDKNPPTKDVYQTLWAAPEALDRALHRLEESIRAAERGRDIGIAITEWGAIFNFEAAWIDHLKTLGTSVYLARVMQVFIDHPKVRVANYFKFNDRVFMGWIAPDGTPKIPYYVIKLFTQHFGSTRVAAKIEGDRIPTFSSRALGATGGEKDVREVTVVASRDESRRKIFINLVNRSWNMAHSVKIVLDHASPKDAAVVWSISSPGVTDHNGRDLPPQLPIRFAEPPVSSAAKLPLAIDQRAVSLTEPLLLPPFSIVTLEADLQP
jgi:alpha-N-arabinofuranosidase